MSTTGINIVASMVIIQVVIQIVIMIGATDSDQLVLGVPHKG